MATKKKTAKEPVEQPKEDVTLKVKELQAQRKSASAQDKIFIDQEILRITSEV